MAIDTRQKRMSALLNRSVLPVADGTFNGADSAHLLALYSADYGGAPPVPEGQPYTLRALYIPYQQVGNRIVRGTF